MLPIRLYNMTDHGFMYRFCLYPVGNNLYKTNIIPLARNKNNRQLKHVEILFELNLPNLPNKTVPKMFSLF